MLNKNNDLNNNLSCEVKTKLHEIFSDKIPLAYIHSFGCQQNISDGEKIKGIVLELGYGFTDNIDDADLVVYNTCAVREHAEDRVFGNIGALKHSKKRNKNLIIGVCGCMTEQEHVSEKIKKSFPHTDFVIGTNAIHMIPEIIKKILTNGKRVFLPSLQNHEIIENMPTVRDGDIKANVPIMYGCDNFCSYCIVPYVRGREKSRKSQDILNEVKMLVNAGYKEIMLLGQNVNSYGKGLDENINFSQLLRLINDIDGDFRVRFMTSHPKDASFELIDAMAECEKVCKHLHLPVQSGSNRILKLMNRKYEIEQYIKLTQYAKDKIPNITLTSDIIVGFPGETYEDFQQTLELIKRVKYSALYTFIFSPRKGTKAFDMEDNVPYSEKSKWFTEMLKVQEQASSDLNNSLVGQNVRILADSIGKSGDGFVSGRTEGNIICEVKGNKELIGKFLNVKVTKAMNWAVFGEII